MGVPYWSNQKAGQVEFPAEWAAHLNAAMRIFLSSLPKLNGNDPRALDNRTNSAMSGSVDGTGTGEGELAS